MVRMKGSAPRSAITSVFMWEWKAKQKCNEKVWFHLGVVYLQSQDLPAHTHSYRIKIKRKRCRENFTVACATKRSFGGKAQKKQSHKN